MLRLCLKNPKTPKFLNLRQLEILKTKEVVSVAIPEKRLSFNDWSESVLHKPNEFFNGVLKSPILKTK